MADVTREQIDQALSKRESYRSATPDRQAVIRQQVYTEFGIGEDEQGAPKAGLSSQGIQPPRELSPGVIRPSPTLHPVFGAIERVSPGTGGMMQDVAIREAIPTALTAAGGELAVGAKLGMKGAALL